jgi:GT2 family glycosyltransferase
MRDESRIITVILNWNRPAMTADCVRHALTQNVSGGQAVLVIDNGSTAENRTELRRLLPDECIFIQNESNSGFAGGMNVGIQFAIQNGYEFVWLLNNDAFPDRGCLASLTATMDADPTLAAVTPRLVYPDGSGQLIGGRIDWTNGELVFLIHEEIPCPTPPGYYATGAALLVRCRALRDVGGFDARFFAYWEEVDLCVRLVRHGSWNLRSVSDSRCVHVERASTGSDISPLAVHLFCRNRYLMLKNHLTFRSWVPAVLRVTQLQLQQAGEYAARYPNLGKATVGGIWSAMTNRFGRPTRLNAPAWFERITLSHWWGLSRIINRVAKWAGLAKFRSPQFRRVSAVGGS